ncbi:MAG: hypothetical protein NC211_03130 [Alistipes senegalensis]|nr:DNA-3-methyladenine glycosylase 2 family protein [Oxalobacter formigenes]MCM1280814.1 hypothetical protein [Alistipes senegalensis]
MSETGGNALPEPPYWQEAETVLAGKDPVMRRLIASAGRSYPARRGEPFETLVRAIVGQQLSVRAAETIWQRFQGMCPVCSPEAVIQIDGARFQACGFSRRKAEYVRDLAGCFRDETVDPGKWETMDDEAVIADLSQVKGIGRWTAEMFLIFNLRHPDVLPLDDAGLIRGMGNAYFAGELPGRKKARELAQAWRPWRTVATWYLWRSLTAVPVEY